MPHVAAHLALGLGHVPRGGGGQLLAPRLGGVLRVGAAAVSVGLDTAAHREESSSIVTSIYTLQEKVPQSMQSLLWARVYSLFDYTIVRKLTSYLLSV